MTEQTTLNAGIFTMPEEPDRETRICDRCSGTYVLDDDRPPTVVTGYLRELRRWATQDWCDACWDDGDILEIGDYVEASPRLPTSFLTRETAIHYMHWHERAEEYRPYPEEPDYSEDDDCDYDSGLLDYGTDVLRVLGWPNVSHNALLFGVELEMEARDGYVDSDLVETLGGSRGTKTGTAILKHDGSLAGGRGVELVTLPATLEQHQGSGQWQSWLDSRLQARAMSGAGTTNCGLHVHINRSAMSPLTVGKLVVFLNNPENSGFVTLIAQRRSGSYCSRDERKKHTAAFSGYSRYKDAQGRMLTVYNDRYDIVNITGPRTVEVRMFRGNLRPERVLKAVEFCHALVRFCESAGIVDAALWGNFITWLKSHRKAYPNLCGYLTEKGLLAPPVKFGRAIDPPMVAEA